MLLASLIGLGLPWPGTSAAATASWRFEPASFDFGVQLPEEGPTSAAAFELQNTGEVSLTPAFISVSNESGSGFSLASDGCGHTLAPGAGCTIEITFDPHSGGKKEGTLTVESSTSAVAPATARLIGSGGEPIVVIDPPSVTFDTVTIPTATLPTSSPQRTITVTNAGSADLHIDGLGYEEADPSSSRANFGEYGSSVGPGLCTYETIPPGASCSMSFVFDPRSPGTYSAELKLEDDAPGSPQIIPLYGTAVAETAAVPAPTPKAASLPMLARRPALRTRSRTATFDFSAGYGPNGFECRTSRGQRIFRACTSPVRLRGLKPGLHVFSVRAIGGNGEPGPVRTYHWRVVR